MKIVFTCGGTAGHINPAVALARMFRERHPQCEVLFVGADGGMEVRLLQKEGLPLKTVTISSFYRSLSPSAIRHNLHTLANLGKSNRQAKAILDDFQPDLVVGTGGYASFPLVKAAARRGIPTAIHESNAFPGLTTVTSPGWSMWSWWALRRAAPTMTILRRWWLPALPCAAISSAIPGRRPAPSWALRMTALCC